MDEPFEAEQPMQTAPPALAPPSVDGVLPPGTSPQPAPPAHNLASQTSTMLTDQNALQQTAPVIDDPTANDAGDYIMVDPPAVAPATQDEQSAAPTPVVSTAMEPADEVTQPPVDAPPATGTDTQFSFTAPDPVDTPETTAEAPEETPSPSEPITITTSDESSDLNSIKQQALTQLSTIAQHLDQSPEEKFHTTMMMLQATDDQSLIQTAYDAAQAITDEKTRAQALLDVVNEINYFSQKNS